VRCAGQLRPQLTARPRMADCGPCAAKGAGRLTLHHQSCGTSGMGGAEICAPSGLALLPRSGIVSTPECPPPEPRIGKQPAAPIAMVANLESRAAILQRWNKRLSTPAKGLGIAQGTTPITGMRGLRRHHTAANAPPHPRLQLFTFRPRSTAERP